MRKHLIARLINGLMYDGHCLSLDQEEKIKSVIKELQEKEEEKDERIQNHCESCGD